MPNGDILRFGCMSGVISPSRTTFEACRRLANDENRERRIRPRGHSSTRSLAGAAKDNESRAMASGSEFR